MSKIDPNASRSSFFPNSKETKRVKPRSINSSLIQRNDSMRQKEIENKTGSHAKVDIPSAVRDFAKIKKAVDRAPDIDNSEKVARLKAQVQAGTYSVDYDKLADKILSSEF